MTSRINIQAFPRRAALVKTFVVAMTTVTTALLAFAIPTAHAEPMVANNCPAVGDLSAQMAGWRNRGKTLAQAKEQVDKYYSDPADREMLHRVVERVYMDPHKRLVPEQVSVQITSECLTQQTQQAPPARQGAQHAPTPAAQP
ncbi:hypothetical protein [Robbsia andropogonis]|uniref:hypothetical protein n=1 Tax=Robbsia andropogonis TaxID=28092 RepID=UPI0004674D18|nr:hypothetical protein [Robbsia andropogonis]